MAKFAHRSARCHLDFGQQVIRNTPKTLLKAFLTSKISDTNFFGLQNFGIKVFGHLKCPRKLMSVMISCFSCIYDAQEILDKVQQNLSACNTYMIFKKKTREYGL